MTDSTGEQATSRKPRLAIMGEFSAGKSTLANLLLGSRPLPERVTATRLSPVWLAHGTPSAQREHLDGTRTPVQLHEIGQVPIEDTRVIRLFAESEVLEMFDLIDCPGISDPNMPPEVWERLVPEIDAVLWCTHATQAWRKSEAEVWESIPAHVRARSLLLITRFDKIKSERDKARVMARVRHETDGNFAEIFPVSLTDALAAGEDYVAWEASGAEVFINHLVGMIAGLHKDIAAQASASRQVRPVVKRKTPEAEAAGEAPRPTIQSTARPTIQPTAQPAPQIAAQPGARSVPRTVPAPAPADAPAATLSITPRRPQPEEGPRVIPRRVQSGDARRTARPMRNSEAAESLNQTVVQFQNSGHPGSAAGS